MATFHHYQTSCCQISHSLYHPNKIWLMIFYLPFWKLNRSLASRRCDKPRNTKNVTVAYSLKYDGTQELLETIHEWHHTILTQNWPPPIITLKWVFYLHLYTYHHKIIYPLPPTWMTSFMNGPLGTLVNKCFITKLFEKES